MLKDLSASIKSALVLTPVFLAAMAASAFYSYSSMQEQMMSQVQNAATAQANTIKEALVNMMVTNESIDDKYLQKVSSSGDIKDIHILFRLDSLYFDESYLEDDERRTRLIRREVEVWDINKDFGNEVFFTKESKWFLTCSKHLHPTKPINDLSADKPAVLNSCDQMKALIPFVAEKKCKQCHNVELGSVLGAAVMTVPLDQTARFLESNTLNSLGVFGGFLILALVLNAFVFRTTVAGPIKKLGEIAESIGTGGSDAESLLKGFGKNEVGMLAASLRMMQKNLDTLRYDSAKNERVGAAVKIARSIVHDLRTPLTAVSLVADFLQKHQMVEPEQRAKKFEQLHAAIRKIDDMMQELIDFSQNNFELSIADSSAEEIAETLTKDHEDRFKASNIRFAVSNHSTGTVPMDKERIRRALNHLISNAEHAMPNGGMLSIMMTDNNGSLRIVVEDTGTGMPQEIRDSLFEPFVTGGTKSGAGLGLAIAKKIIELHKGMISFTSEQGKGTEFVVTIPRQNSR
ncbi:MAG: HAMP domain-containing histidine kinase [Ignavibacteriales bacterium]|nr:HAMP domain-containing histidine kinase [Ignavibacteriales bacterium]